ncbi:hypothetical protein TNCV_3629361 [Trichonephila clavipes]|nr:hypothetical protein TNCV_3629361 [Trichonephila clavipes]
MKYHLFYDVRNTPIGRKKKTAVVQISYLWNGIEIRKLAKSVDAGRWANDCFNPCDGRCMQMKSADSATGHRRPVKLISDVGEGSPNFRRVANTSEYRRDKSLHFGVSTVITSEIERGRN